MKKLILAFAILTLFGCGSDDSSLNGDQKNYHAPVVKFVVQSEVIEVYENETIEIKYNIIDPDSDSFDIQIDIYTEQEHSSAIFGDIHTDISKDLVSFKPNEVTEDLQITMEIKVTDDKGLESIDVLNILIKNKIYTAPQITLQQKTEGILEEGGNIVYTYEIIDPDTDISLIKITPFVNSELASTEHDETIGNLDINTDLKEITFTPNRIVGDKTINFGVIVEDEQKLKGEVIISLVIFEAINNEPELNVYFENNTSNFYEDEDITFDLTYSDLDLDDELTLTYKMYSEDSYDEKDEIQDIVVTNIGDKYSIKYDLVFHTPTKIIALEIKISDGSVSKLYRKSFQVNKIEENLIPTISLLDVNGQVLDNNEDIIEILETDILLLNFSVDTTIGDIASYTLTVTPFMIADDFITSEWDLTNTSINDKIIIQSKGVIGMQTDNINVVGDTDFSFSFSIVNEYGYQKEINVPITVIENVVREYETFEEDFNNIIYDYAYKKTLTEEDNVYNLYLDYLVLKRILSFTNKENFIDSFNDIRKNENINIENNIATIYNHLEQDNIDYPVAYASYLYLKEKIENYGLLLIKEANTLVTYDTYNNLPVLTENNIENNSRFIGNLNYGFWIDSSHTDWVFNEKYKILEILQSEITQTCKGE